MTPTSPHPAKARRVRKIWSWQTEKLRHAINLQLEEIEEQLGGHPVPRICCALCTLTARLDRIYKCRQCGLMLCPLCGLDHFNLKVGTAGKICRKQSARQYLEGVLRSLSGRKVTDPQESPRL